jgi:predicted enzyme related to lactoylglutathione lyase
VNGALIVLEHNNLDQIQQNIEAAGGTINIPIFSFPGGKRFHFIDPSGNQLSVWTQLDG